jgi:hypothetical protein
MKATAKTSKALREVWEWKDAVYDEIKSMSCSERQEYYNAALNRVVIERNIALKSCNDGTCVLIKKPV